MSERITKHLAPIVATAIVVLFLLVASVPLMHWFVAEGRQAELDTNRQLWENHAITGYEFTIRMSRFADSPVTFVVSPDGRVEAREGADRARNPDDVPATIPSIFAFVEAAIAEAPDYLDVGYDEDYGHPKSVMLDPDEDTSGDETSLAITYFRPLAADR